MNNSGENGNISFFGAVLLGMFSWLTPGNIDLTLKILTAGGALAAAIFAVRYHWYATQDKKEILKKMRDNDKEGI